MKFKTAGKVSAITDGRVEFEKKPNEVIDCRNPLITFLSELKKVILLY
jgi:hypothetical protein